MKKYILDIAALIITSVGIVGTSWKAVGKPQKQTKKYISENHLSNNQYLRSLPSKSILMNGDIDQDSISKKQKNILRACPIIDQKSNNEKWAIVLKENSITLPNYDYPTIQNRLVKIGPRPRSPDLATELKVK